MSVFQDSRRRVRIAALASSYSTAFLIVAVGLGSMPPIKEGGTRLWDYLEPLAKIAVVVALGSFTTLVAYLRQV